MDEERKLNFLLTATFVSALATRLMMEDLTDRTPLKEDFKMKTKWALGEIEKKLSACVKLFDTYVHPFIIGELKNDTTREFDPLKYDDNLRDANELCRLQLLYWDKCFQNFDNVNETFKFLRSLEGMGVFTEKDIEHYRLR